MRTDYKIGIAVVLFLAVVIVVYNLFAPTVAGPSQRSGSAGQGIADFDRVGSGPEGVFSSGTRFYSPATDDTVIEGIGDSFIGRDAAPRDELARNESPTAQPLGRRPDVAPRPSTPEPVLLPDAQTEPEPATLIVTRPPRTDPPAKPSDAEERVYVVEEGDHGFWGVAVKEYGDGRHWHLIARANPSADSNALRPGQKLKIPAMPRARTFHPPAPSTDSRDAQRRYRVQKDDAGFWGVSEKVYGTGKHWARIAQANPDVNSYGLKVGQELIIPPLPTDRPAAASPARALADGEQWYTVRAGDAGFWDVSKNAYGHGKYWRIVAEANPDVDSGRLRPGQKLRVPPRPVRTEGRPLQATASP